MGGKQGKHSKSGVGNDSKQLKDDYIQYIRREQLRKEIVHKQRVHDNSNIYNHVKKEAQKKDEQIQFQNNSSNNEEMKLAGAAGLNINKSHTPRVQTTNLSKKSKSSKEQCLIDKIDPSKWGGGTSRGQRKSKNIDLYHHNSDPITHDMNSSNKYDSTNSQSISLPKQHQYFGVNANGGIILEGSSLSLQDKSKSQNVFLNSGMSIGGASGSGLGIRRPGSEEDLPMINSSKTFFKIERVSEDTPSSGGGPGHSGSSNGNHNKNTENKLNELNNKEEMDWVVMLLNVLKQKEQTGEPYAKHLLTYIEAQVERGISRLSPREFRQLYIKKIPQEPANGGMRTNSKLMNSMNKSNKFTVLNKGSQIMNMSEFEGQEESIMKYDLIGLSFYEVSDLYKKKFLVLYSHFKDHDQFPIRKLMDEYRKWLEDFIFEKQDQIKRSALYFQKDQIQDYKRQNFLKLFQMIVTQIKEVVVMLVKAMVLFYQLDFRAGEITEVCLYNLITSLMLKNPIYTKIIDLIKRSYEDQIHLIEQQIEKVVAQRWDIARVFSINEVDIGKKIIQKQQIKDEIIIVEEDDQEDGSSQYSEYNKIENQKAKEVFEKSLHKLFFIKSYSSPTAKIEHLSIVFNQILPQECINAAEFLQNFMLFVLIKLGKKSADFFVESIYIQSFAHEEIIGKIDEYQNISHIDTALQTLIDGVDKNLNYFQQGVGSRSASTTSYQFDFQSNSSTDRKKSDLSGSDNDSLNNKDHSKQQIDRKTTAKQRKSTFQSTSINDKSPYRNAAENGGFNQRAQSSSNIHQLQQELVESPQKIEQVDPSPLSPGQNLPKTDIIEDDQIELNLNRHHMANLRQERVSQWITHLSFIDEEGTVKTTDQIKTITTDSNLSNSNQASQSQTLTNHYSNNSQQTRSNTYQQQQVFDRATFDDLQSVAQGAVGSSQDEPFILQQIRTLELKNTGTDLLEFSEYNQFSSQSIKEREKMILTTTGSIFQKMMDQRDEISESDRNKLQSFNEDFLRSLINNHQSNAQQQQIRFQTDVQRKIEDEDPYNL
eukprot:403361523